MISVPTQSSSLKEQNVTLLCRCCFRSVNSSTNAGRGIFVFERESLVMRKWQILEFDGKPYYAFIPDDDEPLKMEALPELHEDISLSITEDERQQQTVETTETVVAEEEQIVVDASAEDNLSVEDQSERGSYQEGLEEEEEDEPPDTKSIVINGNAKSEIATTISVKPSNARADLYQVRMQGDLVLLEKLDLDSEGDKPDNKEAEAESPLKLKVEENFPQAYESFEFALQEQEDEEEEQEEQEEVERAEDVMEEEYLQEDEEELQPAQEQLDELDDDSVTQVEVDVVPEDVRQNEAETKGHALKCRACAETFESNLDFRRHVAWTHKRKVCLQENGMYICSVCDFCTQKKSLFATHLERKHETWTRKRDALQTSFPCAACGFVCRSKHSLQSHFIRKHTDRYEHQCKFCPKKFKVKGDLTNHVRFHHKEKPINCDVCGKLCLNSGSLYVHQKWAHYKPKYECTVCKRRMVTQENLNQHMVMQHEKREKIVCAECGKTFTKKDSFKRHTAVHTGSKPYTCVICHKPFARRSQLRQHLLIHTGKRPFVCDICGKAFTQKPGLICHRKTHPGNHPPLPVMPIGDIVKQFTEGYMTGNSIISKSNEEGVEDEQDDLDEEIEEEEDEEGDDEEDEDYDQELEQEIIDEQMLVESDKIE